MALTVGVANPGTLSGVGVANPGTISSVGVAKPGVITSVGNADGSQTTNLVQGAQNTADTTGGGGSAPSAPSQSSAPAYQDKSQDITLQNAGLGAVDAQRQTGVNTVEDNFNRIMGLYNTDDQNADTQYGNESDANQGDLQSNKQTTFQDAVQGRQGLFGTLASLGALNGDGIDLANRAVAAGANTDLTNAADTFATNQNSLDSGYNAFKAQDAQRKAAADQARQNDEKRVNADADKSKQGYLTALANDYQAEGNTGQAKTFADQAAALMPNIANENVPTMDIGYSGSAFTAPTLSSYVGKANNTTVQSTPATGGANNPLSVPGLVAAAKKNGA